MHETVVDRLASGMPARIRFEGLRGVTLDGRVQTVESLPRRSILGDVPNYACRIALDSTPPGLLPGMSAEVEVRAGVLSDVLAIPGEAVTGEQGRKTCFVIGPSGLERRMLALGLSSQDLIEVSEGLKEGEEVVLDPARLPEDFDRRADSPPRDQPETADDAGIP
jgi:HlyD family secretion protein